MLKLPHKHFRLSHPSHLTRPLVLSPVVSENDELIIDIENESNAHDDNWVLDNTPDVVSIENFWNNVEKDIADDPEWYKFDDEE